MPASDQTKGTSTSTSTSTIHKTEISIHPLKSPHEPNQDIEKPPASQSDPPPDGGIAAWLVVLGVWCVSFCSFGWINSIGTFQSYYETTLLREYSPSTISWIPSLQVFFMFAMGPIVGKLYDIFGPRHLILTGSFLHVFGLMMASLSEKYYQVLLSQGVCSAIGVAAIFQPAMGCIPGWFSRRRGAAYGIVSTGSSLGGVVFPIMFVILGLLGVANLTVRARGTRTGGGRGRGLSREGLARPFGEVKMVLLVLGFVCLAFGVFIPINYIVVQAVDAGMGAALAEYLVAILSAGSLLGRLVAGVLSDRIGAYNIFFCVVFMAGVLVLGLWIPASGNAAIIVFAVVFGFASGAYVSLPPALVVGISPLDEIGYRTGLLFLFSSVGGLTSSPIGGAILQRDGGSYTGMKVFSGVMLLVGAGFVMAARVVQTGWVLRAKF